MIPRMGTRQQRHTAPAWASPHRPTRLISLCTPHAAQTVGAGHQGRNVGLGDRRHVGAQQPLLLSTSKGLAATVARTPWQPRGTRHQTRAAHARSNGRRHCKYFRHARSLTASQQWRPLGPMQRGATNAASCCPTASVRAVTAQCGGEAPTHPRPFPRLAASLHAAPQVRGGQQRSARPHRRRARPCRQRRHQRCRAPRHRRSCPCARTRARARVACRPSRC